MPLELLGADGSIIADQHDLVCEVLKAAGGRAVEAVLPSGYGGKLADIVFEGEDVIVEIKSLTTNRAANPAVSTAIGERFVRDRDIGAPIAWGTVQVRLHDLDPRVAANALRIAGKRVLDEAVAANKQIKATKAALGRPNALGVLSIVTPPFKLDRESIA